LSVKVAQRLQLLVGKPVSPTKGSDCQHEVSESALACPQCGWPFVLGPEFCPYCHQPTANKAQGVFGSETLITIPMQQANGEEIPELTPDVQQERLFAQSLFLPDIDAPGRLNDGV